MGFSSLVLCSGVSYLAWSVLCFSWMIQRLFHFSASFKKATAFLSVTISSAIACSSVIPRERIKENRANCNDIEIYFKHWRSDCNKAKALLKSKNLAYTEIDTTHDEILEHEMVERSLRQPVSPIIVYDDLASLNAIGEMNWRLGIDSSVVLEDNCNVVIIGAGPAGLSAALYAARKNLLILGVCPRIEVVARESSFESIFLIQ